MREPQTLAQVDKGLSGMLAPNPVHNRSYGLISTGNNLLQKDLYGGYVVKNSRLNEIAQNYLAPTPKSEASDMPYADGLTRTMLLE